MGPTTNHSRSIYRLSGLLCGGRSFVLHLLLVHHLPRATAQGGVKETPPPYQLDRKFGGPTAVILVIAVIAFFFMGFIAIYLRQWAERRLHRRVRIVVHANEGTPTEPGRLGLDPEAIANLPTFQYSAVRGFKTGEDPLECAVCINEFDDEEILRLLPKCDHAFHTECIDTWLGSHTTCPVCRASVVLQPDELPHVSIPIAASVLDSGQVSSRHDTSIQGAVDVTNPSTVTNQKNPTGSRSMREWVTGIFSRSNTTGHSLVQATENHERFALRFPECVRDQIMHSTLNRTKSCVAFPWAWSSKMSYRNHGVASEARSKGYFYYERFDRDKKSDLWVPSSSVFLYRTLSAKVAAGDEPVAPSKKLLRSASAELSHIETCRSV